MLNWASRFNICLFLDNHAYRMEPHAFECLLAVGSVADLCVPGAGPDLSPRAFQEIGRTPHAFSLLEEFARKNDRDWLFGHFGYDLSSQATDSSQPDRIGFPDLFFFVPEIVIELCMDRIRIGVTTGITADHDQEVRSSQEFIFREILTNHDKTKAVAMQDMGPLQSGFTREEYIQTVEKLREHILRGDCYEINFCQAFFADEIVLDPVAVYLALSDASPTPFGAFYRLEDRYLFCASPERYLARRGQRLLSQPIKGTSPRNLQHPQQDQLNKENLYHSEKDRSENVMVVDLVRNDLSRVCLPGTVQVDELYGIYSFPQVHQMISTVSGTLAPGVGVADCVRETFPMGSMTGAPKKRVMELIAKYERTRRGLFSGALGYMLPGSEADSDSRDFDFNVVIRSIFYNSTNRHLSYQVGSAITFNSEPEKEYEECMLKAEAIRKVLGL